MNFNFDDKKRQIIMLAAAVMIGLVAVAFMSNYVKTSVNMRTEQLAQDFKVKSDAEKEAMKEEFSKMYGKMDAQMKQALEEVKKSMPREEVKKEEPKLPPVTPLSTKMPPNKRAVTIAIDSLSAVGGLVNPGEFVDVIVDLKIPNPQKPAGETDSVTSVVFQNIQVLAVDSKTQVAANQKELEERFKSKLVQETLAVSAEEASLLTFAQANGKVTLSLRSMNEKDTTKAEVANWDSLSEFVEKNQGFVNSSFNHGLRRGVVTTSVRLEDFKKQPGS